MQLDDLERFALLLGSIIAIFILERFLQYLLERKIKNMIQIAVEDVINGLKVIIRLGAAISVLYIAMFIYQLSIEQILGLSTLLGAIVSFASVQAIQNFIAGLFILITRPFGIEDFVSISGKEGVVVEISLNYTKIKTFDMSYIFIPNKKILSATIINYNRKIQKKLDENTKLDSIKYLQSMFDEEEIVRYSFQWGAPLGSLKQAKEKLTEVCNNFTLKFGYRPEYFLYTISHRMEFIFIVITDNADKILENLTDFRDEIVSKFH